MSIKMLLTFARNRSLYKENINFLRQEFRRDPYARKKDYRVDGSAGVRVSTRTYCIPGRPQLADKTEHR